MPEAPPAWRFGAVVLTFAAAVAAFIAGSYVTLVWLPDQPYAAVAGWTIGAFITIIFVVQTRTRRPNFRDATDPDPLRLIAQPNTAPAVLLLLIALGFAMLIDLFSAALTGGFQRSPELLGLDLRGGGLLIGVFFALLFMVIAQPIAEELVFRGVAYPALRAAFSLGPTLLLGALLHASFHLIIYPPNYPFVEIGVRLWWGVGVPFLDALVIGVVRAHQRSTRAAIIVHAGFGLFAVLKLLALAG